MAAIGRSARSAAARVAVSTGRARNEELTRLAEALRAGQADLLAANELDLAKARADGLDSALLDRLELDRARVEAMAEGVAQIAELPDPVGEIVESRPRPSGISVARMRVPLGVIGIVYESRPNVTADAAALCLKAGNAVVLRGGSEALQSNRAIAACIGEALAAAGLPAEAAQVLDFTDREAVGEMLRMPQYIDVVIPRGGTGLVRYVSEHARVPVIKHLDGVCHVYIHAAADLAKAVRVAVNAKTQRYGTCNTAECLLVDAAIAGECLPAIAAELDAAGVEIRACERAAALMPTAISAAADDWGREYLAPILAVRVVDDFDAAVEHIARYGSGHTDAIVTESLPVSQRFVRCVDSSSVMVNASTRFADGFEYGLGAEIGISTDKFHARGPVGLEGLTSLKWVVHGDGHVRT